MYLVSDFCGVKRICILEWKIIRIHISKGPFPIYHQKKENLPFRISSLHKKRLFNTKFNARRSDFLPLFICYTLGCFILRESQTNFSVQRRWQLLLSGRSWGRKIILLYFKLAVALPCGFNSHMLKYFPGFNELSSESSSLYRIVFLSIKENWSQNGRRTINQQTNFSVILSSGSGWLFPSNCPLTLSQESFLLWITLEVT